ncbi:hypothetical protein XELAEV_18037416mg [Xenopus laevis]|uniref:Uncharacterized protein n=1 Tax=Xenopus laevis TaxID=8355 RepID=A0A974CC14_XENLA|nr:hypothetical protein XELAEV_18037416mg [Xenopus laevis]
MEDFLRSIQSAVDQHGLQWVKERFGNLPERSQIPAESKEMERRVTRRRACPPERLSPSQESRAVRRRRSRSPGMPVAKRALENCDRMYNNDMLDLRIAGMIAGMIAAARNAVSTSGVEVPIVTKEQNLRNAENKGNEGGNGTNQKSAVAVEPAISKGKEPEKENTKSKESEVGRSLPISDNARSQTYICFEGPLGAHLSVEIREKIWKNEYVDIFTLLPLERFNLDKWEKGKEARKQEDEDRRRFRLIPRTFSNWLQAFAILASIIGERKPEKCSALFCYMDMILEAFRVHGGTAWLRYDEQFRQRLAVRPSLEWDHKDISLWIKLMNANRPGPSGSLSDWDRRVRNRERVGQ